MQLAPLEIYVAAFDFIADDFLPDFVDFWENDFVDFIHDDLGCGLLGINCKGKRTPTIEFKEWWKNYQTFSSDQIPLDFMDEIRDINDWNYYMYEAEADGLAYEQVQELLGDITYRSYRHFEVAKKFQRRRFMEEIEAQC